MQESKQYYAIPSRDSLMADLGRARDEGQFVVVTGGLGAGKTTLVERVQADSPAGIVHVNVVATLFMSGDDIRATIESALSQHMGGANTDSIRLSLHELRESLDERGVRVCVTVDDAHELGGEALQALIEIFDNSERPIRSALLLFGESQLSVTLASAIGDGMAQVAPLTYRLAPMSDEESLSFLRSQFGDLQVDAAIDSDPDGIRELIKRGGGHPGTLKILFADVIDMPQQTAVSGLIPLRVPTIYLKTTAVLVLLIVVIGLLPSRNFEDQPQVQIVLQPAGSGVVTGVARPDAADLPEPPTAASPILPESSGPLVSTDVLSANAEATELLPSSDEPATRAEPQQIAQTEVQRSVGGDSGPSHYTLAEAEILDLAPGTYVIQLMGARDERRVQTFVRDMGLEASAIYVQVELQGQPWFVALYGRFESRDAADAARKALPGRVLELKPWIREIGEVQGALRSRNA